MLTEALTDLLMFLACACLCAWLVLLCREKDFHPLRDIAAFVGRLTRFGRFIFAALFLTTWFIFAVKPGDVSPGPGARHAAVAHFEPIVSTNTTRVLATEDFARGFVQTSANYCWQKQETLKGSQFVAGTAHGGWGFHRRAASADPESTPITETYSPGEAADMVADGSVTNSPVFNRGYAPMFRRNASEEEVFMTLAKYVPAVSSAVGGNMVVSDRVSDNIDMNMDVLLPNGWGRPKINKRLRA